MDISDKLSAEGLVSEFCKFLKTPPNSWPIESRGENSLQYRISDYHFSLEFKEDGWRYHLGIERQGRDIENWGEVPYSAPGEPNLSRLFKENMDLGRRMLEDSK